MACLRFATHVSDKDCTFAKLTLLNIYILFQTILALAFILLIARFLLALLKKVATSSEPLSELTIVVVFKNESSQLFGFKDHMQSLLKKNPHITLLLVNDHSNDLTDLDSMMLSKIGTLIHVPAGINGKKLSQRHAVNFVKTRWMMFLDMDCRPRKDFIQNLNNIIPKSSKMCLCRLRPTKQTGFLSRLFDLDFLSLHYAGLASAELGKPLLSNAAMLFVEKSAFVRTLNHRKDWHIASGDDMFTMFAIHELFGAQSVKVALIDHPLGDVDFPSNGKALWNQRLRWIAKTPQIQNRYFQGVSILVFFIQIQLLIFFGFSVVGSPTLVVAMTGWIILSVEILFLLNACWLSNRMDLILYIFPAIFMYPFYLLALVFISQLAHPIWK